MLRTIPTPQLRRICTAGANKMQIVFCGGMYIEKNSLQSANVRAQRVRCSRLNDLVKEGILFDEKRSLARLHTRHRMMHYVRKRSSQLGPGILAAHATFRLMLLGSPPDMVHGATLRETRSSTSLTALRQHSAYPKTGIHPCYSGLQVTGHR